MHRLAALLASLLVTASLLAVTTTASPPAEARSRAGTYAKKAFATTNAARVRHDMKKLRPNKCLHRMAVRQARRMARTEHMHHQDLGKVMRKCGLRLAGENVAYGFPNGRSVVRDGWMKSPGHRANILNRKYRLMGIGARKGHNGRWYVAQVFGRRA